MANDHYIPQFYLKNFSIAGKPGWIYSYKRNLKPIPKAIRSVASEENYYTMKSHIDGVEKDKVDKLFCDMESASAPIIKHLLTATKITLSSDDHEMLSMFIAFLANRTPYTREKLMNLDSAMRIEIGKVFAGNKEVFERYAKEAGVDTDPELLEQTRQMAMEGDKHFYVEYQGGETEDYFLGTALEIADNITPIIQSKNFHILESSSIRMFVTSDNPVVLVRPENYPPQLGIGFLQASILVPLSPVRCLLLTDDKVSKVVLSVKREHMTTLNEHIVQAAHKSVFSNLFSKDIEKAFNKTVEGGNTKAQRVN